MCAGLLGALAEGEQAHALCLWATPDDWRALRPYVTGGFEGVRLSGA